MKTTGLIFLLTFFTLTVAAQEGSSSRFEIGIATGLNVTSLHGDGFERYFDWHYSVPAALHLRYSFSETFSVVANIAYETKGCKGVNMKVVDAQGTSLGSTYSFNYTYNYITIPLLVRYDFKNIPFFVNAGPYIGYLLNYTEKFDLGELDRTSDMHKTDLGFSIGAGVKLPLSDNWNFTAELRNNLGLTDVRAKNDVYPAAPAHPINELNPVYTNSFNVLVGINYQF